MRERRRPAIAGFAAAHLARACGKARSEGSRRRPRSGIGHGRHGEESGGITALCFWGASLGKADSGRQRAIPSAIEAPLDQGQAGARCVQGQWRRTGTIQNELAGSVYGFGHAKKAEALLRIAMH